MDKNCENWDESLPDWESEMKTIRKNIRRRNWKIILTSAVLVISILFGALQFGIPAWEKQYWDPSECTYLEEVTDLELTVNIYNELFGHGKHLLGVTSRKQGFADYALEAIFVDYKTRTHLTEVTYRTASMTRGVLNAASNFWLDTIPGAFPRDAKKYRAEHLQFHQAQIRETLQELPEYVQLHAAVSFSQDLNMEQLQQLSFQYADHSRFLWAILRGSAASTPCGVHLTEYNSQRYDPAFWQDTPYSNLFIERYNWTPAEMEEHIVSMLRFCDDRIQNGRGFVPDQENTDYYRDTLTWFEENGINAYGCYLIASPKVLLEMLEEGTVWYISIVDAQIGF